MSGIQHVLNAINRVPGSPVPKGELVIDQQFMIDFFIWRGLDVKSQKESEERMLIDFSRLLNLDLVCLQSKNIIDEFSEPSNSLAQISALSNEGLFVFWVVNGAFQSTVNRHGLMSLAKLLVREPETIGREMEKISKQILSVIEIGIAGGAHGIIIADDIAHQQNTYMAPAFYETFLLPLWQEQVVAAKKLVAFVFFHSDGNINNILPTIVAAGFDGLQCIESAAGMEISEVKKTYANDLCLMGNIDPALLIDHPANGETGENCEDLNNAVNHLLEKVAPGGGFIFGTCSGLYAGMSPQKVQLMYNLI
jgi:uroporphyrinogen decarboxylase